MDGAAAGVKKEAFRAAFPYTLPILAGFLFLGFSYGLLMGVKGFSFVYPMMMALLIFGGSLEFVAVSLLMGTFAPLETLLITLAIQVRHVFYGISMLDKYKGTGWKKFYLIFGMCDESFSINCTAEIPENIDRGWFMFFVTLLNHSYWVLGATLGGLIGPFVTFDVKGLEFVMTALFVVIFVDQWMKKKDNRLALIGLAIPAVCLAIFGSDYFLIPSLIGILVILTLLRGRLGREVSG